MASLSLWSLTIILMFAGGQCYSESMSCSTINGKTVCEAQKGAGNYAGSSSSAISNPGGSYQDANAMIGNSNTGRSYSSRTAEGNIPNPGFGPNFGAGAFAGKFPYGNPRFGGGSGSPYSPRAIISGRRGNTFVTTSSGSDFTGAGGAVSGSAISGFAGTATGGFAGSGGGIPFSFTSPTFSDSSNVPTRFSVGDSANTGSGGTFVTSTSGSGFTGAGGSFAGSAAGGFAGSATGVFPGSSGGVFVGGGFPFSYPNPTFGDGSYRPTGFSASDSANTGIGSTFATSTSGSDFAGAGGAFAGSAGGAFAGSAAGGFAGAATGGFPAFGGGGVFVGGPSPPVFGPGFPFSFVFGRR